MKKKINKKTNEKRIRYFNILEKKDAVLLWNGYNHCIFDSPIQVI